MGTVLLVEDDAALREITQQMLEMHGLDTLVANNGHEALALLAAGQVDLVLTDIMMPDMNGVALARRVRAEYPGVPVLALTGAILDAANRPLFDEVIAKPFSVRKIGATVAMHLRHATPHPLEATA